MNEQSSRSPGFRFRVNKIPSKSGFDICVAIEIRQPDEQDSRITVKRDVGAKTAARWAKELLKKIDAPKDLLERVDAFHATLKRRNRSDDVDGADD